MKKEDLKRRDFLMYSAIGISGAAVPGILTGCGGKKVEKGGGTNPISEKVRKTMLIDTHEHLINESGRVKAGPTIGRRGANDWTLLLSHYFNYSTILIQLNKSFFAQSKYPKKLFFIKFFFYHPQPFFIT